MISPSTSARPRDAAAVILLRDNTSVDDPEVFWVKRSQKLAFLGGFHAFPGGQLDATDSEASVANADDIATAAAISCAARELFEELGVLVTHGGNALTKGQRESLRDDLESGRMSWPNLLRHYGQQLDAADFTFVGRWVTPPFSARRFDTWFFLVHCPAKQQPWVIPGELESGEWITASEAFNRWRRSEVLAVPPILHALKVLRSGLNNDVTSRFLSIPEAYGQPVRRIEFRPNYICFPVRTPTRPPATHTNCYLVYNSRELLIIDPGSPYEDEQQALASCVDELIAEGRRVREILITHLHPDHIGGVTPLRKHLGGSVPVAAHPLTAEALRGTLEIDLMVEDSDVIELDGEPTITLRAMHTPGHARGHLCLYDERHGTLISGDNVVGLGSVLIDPSEGDMSAYLKTLERMRSLPHLSVLFGGHGPAMANPYQKIDEYISHRLDRERNILSAVQAGSSLPKEIVARVYTDVSPQAHAMAERAVQAHLEKLELERRVVRNDDGWQAI